MRHVIDAHESGSHKEMCWFFICVVERLTVRIHLSVRQCTRQRYQRTVTRPAGRHPDGCTSFRVPLPPCEVSALDRSRSLKRSSVMFNADRTATVRVGCSGIFPWMVLIISSTYVATRRVNSSLSPRSGYSEPKIRTLMLLLSVVIGDAVNHVTDTRRFWRADP